MARIEIAWNPKVIGNSGPCMTVLIANSPELFPANEPSILDFPPPTPVRALLDTGASFSVISRTFAEKFKLFQTGQATEVRSLSSTHLAREYVASVSFPATPLTPFSLLRIRSADFIREPNFACLIGRDILQHWKITFDGRAGKVIIED